MAKFTDEHKQEMKSNFFPEGVHKVKIAAATLGMTQDSKEFMEFDLISDDGNEDRARLWFTTDAAMKYSFNIIKGIFVHNAPEDKKDKAREALDKIKDTEELEKACQNLLGKECWFSVYKNMDRPYTKNDGSTGYSFDRNITGYEPKPRVVKAAPAAPATETASKPSEGGTDEEPFGF